MHVQLTETVGIARFVIIALRLSIDMVLCATRLNHIEFVYGLISCVHFLSNRVCNSNCSISGLPDFQATGLR